MSDLGTMIWKESKELIFQGDSAQWIRPLILFVIAGLVLPLRVGPAWLALPSVMMYIVTIIPFAIIVGFIGDAIAGERERHTLETLLASRMPDRAILLAKVIVTVGYAWAIALGGLLIG